MVQNSSTDPDPGLPPEVIEAIHAGRKIEAIKRLRESRGVDLKTAKLAVDRYLAENPDVARRSGSRSETGLGRLILAVILLALLLLAYRSLS